MAILKTPFTATKVQVGTYLLGVALFSISFLVFLNSTVSFVVTDLIGQNEGVGDAVGSLGFIDEIVVIVMCPVWGMISDSLGVRAVAVVGYTIVGVSLFVFVQARNVYPQLLLARMLFSVGAAATATMVTAILPTMTSASKTSGHAHQPEQPSWDGTHRPSTSILSEAAITSADFQADSDSKGDSKPKRSSVSQIAGLVGMCTGLGALLALGVFLPLPARLGTAGYDRVEALTASFYIVGGIALIIAIICCLGLRNLAGEEMKGWRNLLNRPTDNPMGILANPRFVSSTSRSTAMRRFAESLKLASTDLSIGLGYLGGFVARASSVGIVLFLPLYVNAYFIRTGLCPSEPGEIRDPSDVKSHCRRAYTLAAALSGVSQFIALVSAPIFGWLDGKFHQFLNAPLLVASVAGVVGYVILAGLENPDYNSEGGSALIWLCMALLGISQIGAIVCSLSLLSRGIEGFNDERSGQVAHDTDRQSEVPEVLPSDTEGEEEESSVLLQTHLLRSADTSSVSRSHLKGTIAGIYSLSGGAGILLLTKLGGYLFDNTSPGAPFYMLSIFNAILLVVVLACSVVSKVNRQDKSI